MPRKSAGILLYRLKNGYLEVFLAHPGGPVWAQRDLGVWSVPKGEFTEEEDPQAAAEREFLEETGLDLRGHQLDYLGETRLKSGKIVYCWATAGDIDPATLTCNTFKMEWPPRSGKWQSYPEIDRGEWFTVEQASAKIHPAQVIFIETLAASLDASGKKG